MPRRTKPAAEIVHLPPEEEAGLTMSPIEIIPSREQLATYQVWQGYDSATQQDRASYDNAVDAARYARDTAYAEARRLHAQAIAAADRDFDEASTAAWKTYHSNTDTARRERDQALDTIRHTIRHTIRREITPGVVPGLVGIAVIGDRIAHETPVFYNDDGMYTHPAVRPPAIEVDRPARLCPRCMTVNDIDRWEDDVCPNCGQYVGEPTGEPTKDELDPIDPIDPIDPETPAAPSEDRAGFAGDPADASADASAEAQGEAAPSASGAAE